MAPKKHTVMQEPLLSAVARKLGHAAGTLTKVTQDFADQVSAVPETVAARVREAAQATAIGKSSASARGRIRHARKKLSRVVRPRRTGTGAGSAGTKKRSSRRKPLPRKAGASKLKK